MSVAEENEMKNIMWVCGGFGCGGCGWYTINHQDYFCPTQIANYYEWTVKIFISCKPCQQELNLNT